MTNGIVEINAEDVFKYAHPTYRQFPGEANIGIYLHREPGAGRAVEGEAAAPDFDSAFTSLRQRMAEGKMTERDLKARYDGYTLTSRTNVDYPLDPSIPKINIRAANDLTLRFGPTSYSEFKEDTQRSPLEAQRLQQLGLEQHNDRGYYFSRGIGAVVLAQTSDGAIPLGIRHSEDYDGSVHGPAGWSKFYPEVQRINPWEDAYRELQEETSIVREEVKEMLLLGAVAYPHTLEVDMIFFAPLQPRMTQDEVQRRIATARDKQEHKEWLYVANQDQVQRLVTEGKPPHDSRRLDVVVSTAYGLEVLTECWNRLK
ncbi:MAG: hypothetical protein AABX13_04635 [Nanoarchaeota archaeon]